MPDDPYDAASRALLEAVALELGPWIERCVLERAPDRTEAAASAGRAAVDEVGARLAELVGADIDDQRGTPLELVRDASRFATAVLREAGAPAARRDPWQQRADPDDVYDLGPATWAALGPASAEAGLVWGAAKALRHLARHRPPT